MDSDDQYSEWVKNTQSAEIKKACKHIAQGEDVDQILELFSKSLMNKLLHPILREIKNVTIDQTLLEKDRVEYFKKMKIIGPKSDHIKDDDNE